MDKQTEVVEEVVEQVEDTVDTTEPVTEEIVDRILDTPANPEFDIQGILDDNKDNIATISDDIAEIKSAFETVVGAIETLSIAQKNTLERVDAIEKEKEDEVTAQTPTFSAAFDKRIKSIVGNPAAELKKEKDDESFTGPAEEKEVKKQFGSSFLGNLVETSKVS